MTTARHYRITVTTTNPGRFPRFQVVAPGSCGGVILERFVFTDDLQDDIHDRLLKSHGETLLGATVTPRFGRPKRRRDDEA